MTDQRFPDVPRGYPFPVLELARLEAWRRDRIFERSLAQTAGADRFVFYEGPPTANNVPHVGHVVTRVVKDLFPRYRTMRGDRVDRKAGWDTHGLPVEIEVEKRLGFSGKQQIEEYGIAEFNRACLESVGTYERQWRSMTERVGYWIDLDHPYFTYTNDYIESVWWAISDLARQGLVAEDYKIQPYCARCGTTLSSHELAQNYKEADDPSIWTLFRLDPASRAKDVDGLEHDLSGVALVGWTTTPWTTLANAAVAAHPALLYRVVAHPGPGREHERLLIGDALETAVPVLIERDGKRQLVDLRQQPALAVFRGRDLEGLTYQRLFDFFQPDVRGRVVLGDYVTSSDGTGLVHTAPPFGEDDYRTGQRYGLPMFLSVDSEGRIVSTASPSFAGMWFKDADKPITQDLKERGLLLHADRHRHNYPFCWRCDRPLLYYATKGWFVRTTERKAEMIAANKTIGWHPQHVGDGRFGNWLENVVDWAISRRRYWGTPIPIWRCEDCGEWEVIGAFADLFARAGLVPPNDLLDASQFDPHRPGIDDDRFSWACSCGGRRRRVPEVLDAWFDSGSMPFAQHHYRGEPVRDAQGEVVFDPKQGIGFPASFISEAVDQTRGWFYTLHALGVLLFGRAAYEHCVVLGHVNDEQGRKMSKRLGNVVEPMAVIEETGADALRWYFCVNDPEVPSRFSARLVRDAAQNFLLPLWNALSFFTIYANIDGWRPGRAAAIAFPDRPDLDRWILLRLDDLIERTTASLDAYDIASAAKEIERFVDDLTNWYIRRSRDRFWAGAEAGAAKESAYQTLHHTLTTLARLIAPFTPFVADEIHERLVARATGGSVHLETWPQSERWHEGLALPGDDANSRDLPTAMALAQRIVGLGHAARNAHDIRTRQPLGVATLVFSGAATDAEGAAVRERIETVREIILDELNVGELRWAERRSEFVTHEVRPNFRVLGKKLGGRMKSVQAALAAADGDRLAAHLESRREIRLDVDGEEVVLDTSDLEIRLIEKAGLATANDGEFLLALDTELTPALVAAGRAREVVNRIQTARKERDLAYTDRIRVHYLAAPELREAIERHAREIQRETLATALVADPETNAENMVSAPVDGLEFQFRLELASSSS